MIVFENDGEIDIRSISTFGVSVKEGDSPIGFFGTGLKYAIAILLRTGHTITVFSGDERIEFGLSKEEIRGQNFDFVTMNKSNIGFTTQLGKQWDLWMAYREIACNCKDENGSIFKVNNDPHAEPGKTKIIVTGKDFELVYEKRGEFILEDEPDFVCDSMEVRNRPSSYFYYRGVRVHQMDSVSLYTYNDQKTLALTEDRGLEDKDYIRYHVAAACLRSTNKKFIRDLVIAPINTMEAGLNYEHWGSPSDEFCEVVGKLVADKYTQINLSALKSWQKKTKSKLVPNEIVLTNVQQKMVEKALIFCTGIGFNIKGSYKINFVESLGEGCLGLAENETIFIAERVFHQGTKQIASTLIEEYLHLKQGWRDMSRELQTFLFDKIVSLGEEINGDPL